MPNFNLEIIPIVTPPTAFLQNKSFHDLNAIFFCPTFSTRDGKMLQ